MTPLEVMICWLGGAAEHADTSILFFQRLILKLYRRIQPGENPDAEIGPFLARTVPEFPRIARFLGEILGDDTTTLTLPQGLVENEGDGWQWTLDDSLASTIRGAAWLSAELRYQPVHRVPDTGALCAFR